MAKIQGVLDNLGQVRRRLRLLATQNHNRAGAVCRTLRRQLRGQRVNCAFFETAGVGVLILGLSAYYRDSAAVLIRDGEIVAAAQEERFTRKKCDASFPTNAIAYCLQEAHITLADVDYVVFYKPSYASRGMGSFLSAVPMWLKEKLHLTAALKKELVRQSGLRERALPRLLFTEHHLAQAASAFFPSPFQHAAVVCLGKGESGGSSVWLGAANTLTPQTKIDLPGMLDVTDEAVLKLIRIVQRELQTDQLCLTGDIALSCVTHERLLRETSFKDIWIQPAPGAAGGALGAALTVWYEHLGNARNAPDSIGAAGDFMHGSYLGPWFSIEGIVDYLDEIKAPYTKFDDDAFYSEVSAALAAKKTIGWFQGRMEFGACGIGARSIIGDPRSKKMQSIMNQKIKCAKSLGSLDYSTRVQTGFHLRFDQLRERYEQKEGRSILVTSFNLNDEPIVCTPDDAYRCFMRSDLDCLVLENIILHKHEQPLWEESDAWQSAIVSAHKEGAQQNVD